MNPKIEALINQLEELKNKSDSEACKNLFGTVIEVLKNEPTNDEILEELLSYFWKEGDKINQICPDYYTSFLKILGNLSELFSDDKLKYFHLGVSWYRSGKIHKEKGNLDDAMNCFKNAIRYYENTVNIDSNLANAWYNLGLSWAKSGKIHKEKGNLDDAMNCFKNAIRYCKNAVKINPNLANAWSNLGFSWAKSGEIRKEKGNLDDAMNCFKNAIRYCENAVNIDPNLANAWSDLGILWRMLIKIIPIKPLLNTAISYELTILFNLKRIIDGLNSKLLIESYINKFVFSSLDRLLFYSSLHKNSLTEKKEILEAVEQFKGYFFFKEFVGKQQITDNTNLNKLLKLHEKFNVNKTIENALHSLKNAMQKDNSIDTNLLRYIILESEAENSTNNKEKTREIEQIFYDTLKNISVNFNFDNLNLKTNETIVYLLFREIAIYRDIKRVLTIILVYKNGGEIKVNTKNYDIGGTNIDDYAEISYLLNAKLILPLASNKNLDDNLLKDIKNKIERSLIRDETKNYILDFIESNSLKEFLLIRRKLFADVIDILKRHVLPLIPKDKTRVYISPIGELNRLPVHIALIDEKEVSYLPTAKLLEKRIQLTFSKKALIVFTEEKQLKDEAVEVEKILKEDGYFVEMLNLSQYSNRKEILKKKLEEKDWNIVHFVLHGKYDEDTNMSYLILSPTENLTREDIYLMNLNINLVSLSSCETYTNKKVEGFDEINAIEKAFLVNNVQRVISTYYAVFSKGAKEFSTSYFKQLIKENHNFEKAFRNTVLELKQKGEDEYMFFRYTSKGQDTIVI